MAEADGNGWVECRCGARHWGRFGAAGLLLVQDTRILLQLRAPWVHEPDTWSTPGGAVDSHESVVEAALREAEEENGVPPVAVTVLDTFSSVDHSDWSYTLVVGRLAAETVPYPANAESVEVRWVARDDVEHLPLHPGFAAGWPAASRRLEQLSR